MENNWTNDTPEHKSFMWKCLAVVAFFGTLLLLHFCCGCIASQPITDMLHAVNQVARNGIKAETPEEKDRHFKLIVDSTQIAADKCGPPSVVVTPDNAEERLEKATQDVIDYQPWYTQIPSTGIPWLDTLLALFTTGGGAYLLRKPLRRGLHALTHNAKESV